MLEAVECPDPRTLQEALSSNQAAQWKEVADAEYQSLLDSHTWDLVKLPSGRKSIECKWVFKVKHSEDGSVEKFKGRLWRRALHKGMVWTMMKRSLRSQVHDHMECDCPGSREEDASPSDGCGIGIPEWGSRGRNQHGPA